MKYFFWNKADDAYTRVFACAYLYWLQIDLIVGVIYMIFIIFVIHTFLADGHITFLSLQAVCFSAGLSRAIYFSSSYLFILIT